MHLPVCRNSTQIAAKLTAHIVTHPPALQNVEIINLLLRRDYCLITWDSLK